MRPANLLSRLPGTLRSYLPLALGVVLTLGGAVLIVDRPGLEAEYFGLSEPWQGAPYAVMVGEPALEEVGDLDDILKTKVIFSVRWRGWWRVSEGGEHRLSIAADDGGYLKLDGELLLDSRGTFGRPSHGAVVHLEPGFHALEIGLYQTHGESRLAVHSQPPGASREEAAPLPGADLYSGRPLYARAALRGWFAGWTLPYRRMLGACLLLAAALLWKRIARPAGEFLRPLSQRLQAAGGPRLRAALVLALFAVAFFATLPYTGPIRGGDDAAYLSAARFDQQSWFFNRYAHVYLVKLFMGLSGGDPFAGVRLWWSFTFGVTVAAIAVATTSLGPGFQLRTLTAIFFVLIAQTTIFGLIGAGFADYSAMMFVTVSVAVYVRGMLAPRNADPPRHEWHALALGALAVASFRSKEVGAVVLLLPALFVFAEGKVDLRRFLRRACYWAAGAGGVLLTLTLLDGLIQGDPLSAFRAERLATARHMNFPDGVRQRHPGVSWLNTIWKPGSPDLALRGLWIAVGGAAILAGLRRRRIELRLLHLMPMAYVIGLIGLFVRMPHPFSERMLIPILPTGCLLAGLLLHYAGLDDISWRKLSKPAVALPAALAGAFVCFAAIPYRLGAIEPQSFLPVELLLRYGWQPDHFVHGVLLPAAALLFATWFALVARRRAARVAALLLLFLAVFGAPFEITRNSLIQHHARQTADLLLYPWRTFHDDLVDPPVQLVSLSQDLLWRLNMSATAHTSIGRLAMQKPDLHVSHARQRIPAPAEVAIGSRWAYNEWRRNDPALEATAKFGPAGVLVLVRPQGLSSDR